MTAEDITRCMKCGNCQAVCPTFEVTGCESMVARGRIRLIKALDDGDIGLTDTFIEKLDTCMMCKACTANCPSDVDVGRIILAARERVVKERGLPLFKRAVFKAIKHPALLRFGVMCAPFYRPFLKSKFKIPPGKPFIKNSMKNRGLMPGEVEGRISRGSGGSKRSAAGLRRKVVFFAGCSANYLYPEVGDAVLDVLTENGVEVIVNDEVCCGISALYSGDSRTTRYLAGKNLEYMKHIIFDVDAVITSCPSCKIALKEYPVLLENSLLAAEVSRKVRDISEYLVQTGFRKGKNTIPETVSYHDPCHLSYELGIKNEPREIIMSIPGIELKELGEGCCGLAGLFSVAHPDMSRKIRDNRIEAIMAADAGIIATGCLGCKMYLEMGLKQKGIDRKVMHTIELLRQSYKIL